MKCAIGTRCEKCGSTNITKELIQSYSMGKGLAGQAIFGAGGAAMGVNGKQEYIYNCQACGHTSKNIMDMYTNSDIQKAIFDPTAYASLKHDLQSKYPNIDWSGNDIGVKPLGAGNIEATDKHFKINNGHLVGIDVDYQMVMTKAIIPNGVTHIEAKAFMFSTRLKEVILPASLISIGDSAFNICEALVSINIPSTVKYIGNEAFSSCKSLRRIYIPKNVETIGKEIFKFCNNKLTVECEAESKPKGWHKLWHRISSMYLFINEYANVQWGVETKPVITQKNTTQQKGNNEFEIENDQLIKYHTLFSKQTSITIPYGVKIIGEAAFAGNGNRMLASIILPSSVTKIEKDAFQYRKNLTSITIPDSVRSIGTNAFVGCDNLQFNEYDNALYLGNESNKYVVLVKAKNSDISSCNINENTKIIYNEAFKRCKNLKNIVIPENIISISSNAFEGCNNL